MKRAAVFLDRDGVINVNRADYVKSWDEFEFLPSTLAALRQLAVLELPVIVVTNQTIVGRGVTPRHVLDEMHRRMQHEVSLAGGRIDEVMVCPHRSDEGCACRKPRPGMILQSAERLSLDLSASFLVGDAETDVQAARAAGCQPVFVTSGRGNALLARLHEPHLRGMPIAADLAGAVEWITPRIMASASMKV